MNHRASVLVSVAVVVVSWSTMAIAGCLSNGFCDTKAEAAQLAKIAKANLDADAAYAWSFGTSPAWQIQCNMHISDRRELKILEVNLNGQNAIAVECPDYGVPGHSYPVTLGQGYWTEPVTALSNQNSGDKSKCPNCKSAVGNPIGVDSGNKYQREVDYVDPTNSGRLSFVRHYNSDTSFEGNEVGPNWTHGFARKVVFNPDYPAYATVYRDDGQSVV